MEIRLGTIGSNFIVHNLLRHVVKTPGWQLTAVYSRSEEKAEALAAQYGAERYYCDMEEFLSDEEVNFVYIATPNVLHCEQAKAALLAGKHVLLEKPFCPEVSLARELVEIAWQRGLILADMTPTASLPNLPLLKEQLPKIGKIRQVLGNYTQYSSRYDAFRRGEIANVFTLEACGGSLMDINYYNAYLNAALFGKPEMAVYYPNIQRDIDTSGLLVLSYEGFTSQNVGAKDCRGQSFFQIQGEDGYIYIPGGVNDLQEVQVVTKEGTEVFRTAHEPDVWGWEVKRLAELITTGNTEPLRRELQTMLIAIEIVEKSRKAAGIHFPSDLEP